MSENYLALQVLMYFALKSHNILINGSVLAISNKIKTYITTRTGLKTSITVRYRVICNYRLLNRMRSTEIRLRIRWLVAMRLVMVRRGNSGEFDIFGLLQEEIMKS